MVSTKTASQDLRSRVKPLYSLTFQVSFVSSFAQHNFKIALADRPIFRMFL